MVLPLLSSVLRRCWENSSGGVLTPADYFTTGGLWSALNREADSIYEWQRLVPGVAFIDGCQPG